jgi:hypothetical protein
VAFIQKQLVPVQFGGGVDTKVDPKQLQAGKLLDLKNGQFSKTGQINKRFGYDLIGNNIEGGGSIGAGVELAVFKNELLLFDGTSVYSYLPATGNWSNRGTAVSIITEDREIVRRQDAQQLNPDMAYASGVEVYAWEDSRGGVFYSVVDSTSGAVVVAGTQLAASPAQQPKCIAFNGNIYVFYASGTKLYYQIVGPLNPSVVQVAVVVATDGYSGTNGFPYDVDSFTASNGSAHIAFAYLSSASTSSVVLTSLDINNIQSVVTTVNTTHAITGGKHGAMSVIVDSLGTAWVSWSSGAAVYTCPVANYGAGGTSLGTEATVFASGQYNVLAAIENYTAGQLLLFCEKFNSTSYLEQTDYVTVTTAATVSATKTLYSVGLASKPWSYGSKIFVNTSYSSTLQATDFGWYIPATGSAVLVAKMTPSVGGGLNTLGMCAETVKVTTGVYKFANLVAGKILSEANTIFSILGVNATKLTHSPTDNFINTVQDSTLLIVGGILQGYDGVSVTELGFNLYPENVTLAATGSDGNLGAGSYQYVVEYEWTDNNGQIYRSAPSVRATITTAATNHVTVSGYYLTLTSKPPTSISIVIYRTLVNGTNLYRITSLLAPKANSGTAGQWTFVDTNSDTTISSNDLNYTTGGTLSNIAPPANAFLTTYNNRVFLGGLSDKNLLWYSQTVADNSNANTIPPQFCAELTMGCDPRGGDITALGLLNQTLIIFKSGEIFAVGGNGPDANGNNSDYGDPQLISSDVGCINPNTVVITAAGLFFQSQRGIYLLDQSLNTSYVGSPVEDVVNAMTITSCVESPRDAQIIFCSSNGTAVVYDYFHEQWSTWTNHYAADVVIYRNAITYVTPGGRVYMQNRTSFTDAGTSVLMSWTLPNLAFAGIQGYQRVFRCFILGTYKGPHQLQVNVAYDYNDSYTQTATVSTSSSSGSQWGSDPAWGWSSPWGGTYQLYEFRVDFSTQKCTAIRLQVTDAQSSSYNEGYAISSVVFEVGQLPGGNRLPATSTYGAK